MFIILGYIYYAGHKNLFLNVCLNFLYVHLYNIMSIKYDEICVCTTKESKEEVNSSRVPIPKQSNMY